MKKIFLLLICISLSLIAYAKPIKVTVHTDSGLDPYSFGVNETVEGIYVNILKTAFSKMKDFEVTLKGVPWKRGKQMMERGDGFALATAYFHGHDWDYLFPYSLPFAIDTLNVYCEENILSTPRHSWPDNYKGLKIGRPTGFDGWGGDEFHKMVKEGTITLEENTSSLDTIKKLGAGRIDCIMMEKTMMELNMRNLKKEGKWRSSWVNVKFGANISTNNVYIGYSKKVLESGVYPWHLKFRQSFDSVIYQMERSGEIQKIIDSY